MGGRLLLQEGQIIDLYDPATGELRQLADQGDQPVFFPAGDAFAYIRAGGCFPTGPESCFTEYSVFEKSLDVEDEAAPGRQVFGWTDFFVRAIDLTPEGRIVFSAKAGPGPAEDGRTLEIYSARLDGGDLRQLTHNAVFDNDPVVSPDGRRIAFSRKVKGRGQIFTMSIDGGHLKRTTRDSARNRQPTWSPDGRRIVYLSQPPGHAAFEEREIYSAGADGGRKRRLTRNQLTEGAAVFSPDGEWIAYLQLGAVWLMKPDGSRQHQLLPVSGGPGYSDLDWAAASS
jgi:Tol biopolymer transport system component